MMTRRIRNRKMRLKKTFRRLLSEHFNSLLMDIVLS